MHFCVADTYVREIGLSEHITSLFRIKILTLRTLATALLPFLGILGLGVRVIIEYYDGYYVL
jgi:hypothetical protein